jgi:predicted PurR-regulated permease PerM
VTLAGILISRFGGLIRLLIAAGIVAIVLSPLVRLIHTRARLSWRLATHLVFLLLLVLVVMTFTATGLALAQEIQSLVTIVRAVLADLPLWLENLSQQVVQLGPFEFALSNYDLAALAAQAEVYLRPLLGQASGLVTMLAGGAVETVARTIFILAAAYFLTLDQPALVGSWKRSAIPGYEYDWGRLRRALDRIWAAFLRGQIMLALIIAISVTIGLSVLGVRNALVLGLVSGLLEFLPIVGPFIAGGITALVAFFQASNWWGLPPLTFTLIVIAFFIVVQQIENNVLVPRILGTALNLHPVVILVAAVIGATVAGVMGILLSAPTVATLLLIGRYGYRKIFDLPPWDPPIDGLLGHGPPEPPRRRRWAFWRRNPEPGRTPAGESDARNG